MGTTVVEEVDRRVTTSSQFLNTRIKNYSDLRTPILVKKTYIPTSYKLLGSCVT